MTPYTPAAWMPDWPRHAQEPRKAPSPQPYHGMGLTFPAEISIKAAPQLGYRRHELGSRVRQIHAMNPTHAADQPPYPVTPHLPQIAVPESQTPRLVESGTFLPRTMQRTASAQDKASCQEHYFQPARVLQPKQGFMILHDEPKAQDEQRFATFVTNEAEFLIIMPLREGSSRYTNHDMDHSLIEHVETAELFVRKRWNISSNHHLRKRALVESKALWQIKHAGSSPHIIGIFETFFEPYSIYCSMITEYCDCGTLEDFINRYIREDKSTPEAFAWHVLSSLVSALCMCHYGMSDAQSLITTQPWATLYHFDVQPGSIWLSSQDTAYPRVVLGNFSCVSSRVEVESGEAHNAIQRYGTSAWLPPEAHSNRHFAAILGKCTDIWQAGAVIQAMCYLIRTPDMALAERPCGSRYSFTLNNIISCCMNWDCANRPTAVDLMREIERGRHTPRWKADGQSRYQDRR